MSRTKKAIRNIIWGIAARFVHMFMPFIARTVVIYMLGTLYLGIGSLFTSILGLLSLSELGFSSAIAYSMYKPIAEKDSNKIRALLNFYKKCYKVIGILMLTVGILLMPFIKYLINGDYPQDANIYIIYLIYLLNTSVGYLLFSYKRVLFTVSQRNDIENKIATITSFSQYVFQILVLLVFRNFYFYVAFFVITTVVDNILVEKAASIKFPQYFCQGNLNKKDLSQLSKQLGGLFMQKLGGVVLISADNIVISAFLGLNLVAQYGNYYSLITSLNSVMAVIRTSLLGGIGNSIASESVEYNVRVFKSLNLLYFFLVAVLSIAYLCLIQPFMQLWMGTELMFSNDIAFLFAFQFFSMKWMDIVIVFQEACGIWWNTRFVPIIAAIVNLGTNIFLVMNIGISGVLISTIISGLFAYDLGYAYFLLKKYFGESYRFRVFLLKQSYLVVVAAITAFVSYIVCLSFEAEKMMALLLRGIIVLIVAPTILLLLTCKLQEFRMSMDYIRNIMKH